jgi:predicted RNase H-like HicB family nuclease
MERVGEYGALLSLSILGVSHLSKEKPLSLLTTSSFPLPLPPPSACCIIISSRRTWVMLLQYIQAALNEARYEILSDDGSYYGEIPPCNGVYANATTLEACRQELQEVLEAWLLFRVHRNLPIPSSLHFR